MATSVVTLTVCHPRTAGAVTIRPAGAAAGWVPGRRPVGPGVARPTRGCGGGRVAATGGR